MLLSSLVGFAAVPANAATVAPGYTWGTQAGSGLGTPEVNAWVATPLARGGIPLTSTVTQVSTVGFATCVVASGKIYCTGSNEHFRLGTADALDKMEFTLVETGALVGKTVVRVEVDFLHTCALTDEATNNLYCWGANWTGQLGDGTLNDHQVPFNVTAGGLSGKKVTDMSLAHGITCAVTDEATNNAYCWGREYVMPNDQLALGRTLTPGDRTLPGVIDFSNHLAGKQVETIWAAGRATCALTTESSDNTYCWGTNDNGVLGDGSGTNTASPRPLSAVGATAGKRLVTLGSGQAHICGVDTAGVAYCWGFNYDGQLGNGNWTDQSIPVKVDDTGVLAGKSIVSIFGTFNMTCALDSAGVGYCWGAAFMLMGDNRATDGRQNVPVPMAMPTGVTFSKPSIGGDFACVLGSDAWAWCWGNYGNGGRGDGTGYYRSMPYPIYNSELPAGQYFDKLTTGLYTTCGLSSGEIYCWGENGDGQLGTGDTVDRAGPAKVVMTGALLGKTIVDVQAQSEAACALDDAGAVYCWGSNQFGQLGTGDTTYQPTPTAVDMSGMNGEVFSQITATNYSMCGLTTVGNIWCWGENNDGLLGVNNSSDQLTPVAASRTNAGSAVFTYIDLGIYGGCALDTANEIWCWGTLPTDQFDQPSWTNFYDAIPAKNGPLVGKTITSLSVGAQIICVLADGAPYCTGDNGYGAFGDGTTDYYTGWVATDVSGALAGKTLTQVAAGGPDGSAFTCALDDTGQAYCWGYNSDGHLGLGHTNETLLPEAVAQGSARFSQLILGQELSMALTLVPQYTVTVATAGAGSGSVSQSTITLDDGAAFSSLATANAGSTFAGWSCTPSTYNTVSATLSFTVTEDVSCTATFNLSAPSHGVSSITPNHSKLSGGIKVTVIGTGFTSRTKVYVGGKEVKIKSRSGSTRFTFETPSAKRTGWVSVRVVTGVNSTTVEQGIYYDPDRRRRD